MMVMGGSPQGSEAFGPQQRHHEINAQREGDEETEKRLKHCQAFLKPVEGAGINGKRQKRAAAERQINEIGHVRSPVGTEDRLRPCRVRVRLGRWERGIRKT
jgi:hypothetical protein